MAKAAACIMPDTHHWYLFSVVRQGDFRSQTNAKTLENWASYTDGAVEYWFDANAVKAVAKCKGDTLMLGYVDHLQQYLKIASDIETETWDYPTKEQLASQQQKINQVRSYAQARLGSRMNSQHALLFMRCNMLLGLHEDNILFWEQKGSKLDATVYRDMMCNIYAGALLKCHRTDEATQIFVEQGDLESLNTYFYDKRSPEDIARIYNLDPDSPALPFLLQDFANNAQETIDELQECNWQGKLFVRNVAKDESQQMCQLARQAVEEGKSSHPALWKSLEAWLTYLMDDKAKAASIICEAADMKDNEAIKDNARVLRLYILADIGKADDDFLAKELTWLEGRIDQRPEDDIVYTNHFMQVFDRLTQEVFVDRWTKERRPELAAAILNVYEQQASKMLRNGAPNDDSQLSYDIDWNDNYDGRFFCHIDTIPAASLERLLDFKPKSALDKWIYSRMDINEEFLHEVLGTKYLRQQEWQKATSHLKQVTMDFITRMNIAPFMAQRDYTIEPWLKRQWIKAGLQQPGAAIPTTNQKLLFANDMQQMEEDYRKATGLQRQHLAYQLAVRYYQASLFGDAWYITCYGKSSYYNSSEGYPQYVERAWQLLDEAIESTDYSLRERAIFARAFSPYDNWHEFEWDDKTDKLVAIPIKTSQEYKAMKRLADFVKANRQQLSAYVSRCDVLKQFMKQQ